MLNGHDDILPPKPVAAKVGSPVLSFPAMISGTSSLGNLYEALPPEKKLGLVKAYLEQVPYNSLFDTAGKYGAGLALEVLGQCLAHLEVDPQSVIISNKLGWFRTEMTGSEPTFEKGVWKDLVYDAMQKISYEGILECYEQGNQLLGRYRPQLLSVHDPDEYLAAATGGKDVKSRHDDILEAYRALRELKAHGQAQFIGIGAKHWPTIHQLAEEIELDWVMLANSLTLFDHPPKLLDLIASLHRRGIAVINSAVFNGGFLVGGDYFNYRPISHSNPAHEKLLRWRNTFFAICRKFDITPAHACIQFGISIPGITSVALNSTAADRIRQNLTMTAVSLPSSFWSALKDNGIIRKDYPYL